MHDTETTSIIDLTMNTPIIDLTMSTVIPRFNETQISNTAVDLTISSDSSESSKNSRKSSKKKKAKQSTLKRAMKLISEEYLLYNASKDIENIQIRDMFRVNKCGLVRTGLTTVTSINKKTIKKRIKKIIKSLKKAKVRKSDNPTLKEAILRSDWPEWEKAIETEYNQIESDGVYEEYNKKLKVGDNLLGAMVILQLKRKPDGTIDKYKATLVALGNQQKASPYKDIRSGTARSATVKLLMSLQAKTSALSMVLDI